MSLPRIIPDVSDLKIKRDKIARQDLNFIKKVMAPYAEKKSEVTRDGNPSWSSQI